MEALQQAEYELGGISRYVSANLSLHGDDASAMQRLTFSAAEELALEGKVSDGISAYQCALAAAQDWVQDLRDPKEAQDKAERLQRHRVQLQIHVVSCRKALVAYRQRAKLERLERQRRSLLPQSPKDRKATAASGSAVDVTAALRRTKQVMSQEMERVSSVTKVLDDGRLSLRSSHEEYSGVQAEIAEVRKRLKVLEWQAKQDKMWIAAGIILLVSTVAFIVYERTGLVFI